MKWKTLGRMLLGLAVTGITGVLAGGPAQANPAPVRCEVRSTVSRDPKIEVIATEHGRIVVTVVGIEVKEGSSSVVITASLVVISDPETNMVVRDLVEVQKDRDYVSVRRQGSDVVLYRAKRR